MQAVEVVGDDVDGDADGVRNELTIGDMTALTVYMAAQPRPTTLLELNRLDLLDPPLDRHADHTDQSRPAGLRRGRLCHLPRTAADVEPADLQRAEPERGLSRRGEVPGRAADGQRASIRGIQSPWISTRDQPDNIIHRADGSVRARLGSFTQRDSAGRTIVEMYGDLKRHAMGPRLAEPVNEIAGDDVTPIPIDPAQPPHPRYVPDREPVGRRLDRAVPARRARHDARRGDPRARRRRTTTRRARLGPLAPRTSRASLADKQALIAFLENLVLFKVEEEEEAAAARSADGAAVAGRRAVTAAAGEDRAEGIQDQARVGGNLIA